jgi:hypothetical protein
VSLPHYSPLLQTIRIRRVYASYSERPRSDIALAHAHPEPTLTARDSANRAVEMQHARHRVLAGVNPVDGS